MTYLNEVAAPDVVELHGYWACRYTRWVNSPRFQAGWRLSDDVKLEPQRLGKASGWRKIAIRFRVKPGNKPATYRIDDVLIDPRRYN